MIQNDYVTRLLYPNSFYMAAFLKFFLAAVRPAILYVSEFWNVDKIKSTENKNTRCTKRVTKEYKWKTHIL